MGSVEVNYIKNALAHFAKSPETYDVSRVFTSGCSMGSAFSGYIGNCLKKWDPSQISAFATHSTGLKKKGDGNRLPENWGECDGCQWWPFAPVNYSDNLGLKASIFDNTGDGDFYKTSVYLSKEWPLWEIHRSLISLLVDIARIFHTLISSSALASQARLHQAHHQAPHLHLRRHPLLHLLHLHLHHP